MYRSTTPKIILRVKDPGFDLNEIDICHVSLKAESNGHSILIDDPVIDTEERTISFSLTQEQTLGFNLGTIKIQIKAKMNDGSVVASKVVRTKMNEILEEDVL